MLNLRQATEPMTTEDLDADAPTDSHFSAPAFAAVTPSIITGNLGADLVDFDSYSGSTSSGAPPDGPTEMSMMSFATPAEQIASGDDAKKEQEVRTAVQASVILDVYTCVAMWRRATCKKYQSKRLSI